MKTIDDVLGEKAMLQSDAYMDFRKHLKANGRDPNKISPTAYFMAGWKAKEELYKQSADQPPKAELPDADDMEIEKLAREWSNVLHPGGYQNRRAKAEYGFACGFRVALALLNAAKGEYEV